MINIFFSLVALVIFGVAGVSQSVGSPAEAKSKTKSAAVAYGKKSDVILAKKLWKALEARGVVGPDRINVHAYQGKPGYDPENQDWFWVRYWSNGKITRTGSNIAVAGRVGKVAKVGCIGCHRKSGGKDMESLTSR